MNTRGTEVSVTDTSGIGRAFPASGGYNQGAYGSALGPVNNSNFGIVIGSGSSAVSPTDYSLAQQITHGSGANQMVHGTQTTETVQVVGQTSSVRATRTFTNNSGAIIIVREIGWIISFYDTGAAQRYALFLRDVLPSAVAVPDGSTFTVRYTISVTA